MFILYRFLFGIDVIRDFQFNNDEKLHLKDIFYNQIF